MHIRSKLVLVFGLGLAINLAVGLYAIYINRIATDNASRIYERSSQIVATSLTAQVHFKKQVQEWKDILLRGHDTALYEKYLNQFYHQEQLTREWIERLIALLDNYSVAKQTALQFLESHYELGERYREALRQFQPGTYSALIRVDQGVRGIDRQPTDLLDEVVSASQQYKNEQLQLIANDLKRLEQDTPLLMGLAMTSAILLLLWLIDRTVGQPIAAATHIAQLISEGQLSNRIEVSGRDEAARLLQALNNMQESLRSYQDELQESEARTRLLLNSSGEGIYGVGLDGICTFCNPAAMRMLGYREVTDLIGKDIHNLMHHTKMDGSPLPIEECRASATYHTGRPTHVDDELFWRADGSSFPVEYRSHPIYQDEVLIGAVVTFSDITQRRIDELALQKAHTALAEERSLLALRIQERTHELNIVNLELAKSSRAKDEFLATMSHELRTPLTTILGISEMLVDQLYGPLDPRQSRVIDTIHESGTHLLSLINDILDVVKVEAGKMEIAWEPVSVDQLCEASLRLVRQSAKRKILQINSQIDPQVKVIQGDARRLKQLLVNLLGNAVKFTPEGGAIGLEVNADPTREQACFTVWDTGIGIPKEQQDKLFKPFVQLENRMSQGHSGTGLGLVLAYRMAKLHGGSITLSSEPGEGSRFQVNLPWHPLDNEMPKSDDSIIEEAPPLMLTEDHQPWLLLADDNQTNAHVLSSYLAHMGYQITTVHDGVEAVAAALEQRPDIILLDIQLKSIDGLEVTRRLRAQEPTRNTPIIALTALAMPGDRERCLEAGVSDYLSKPVGMKALHRLLQSWL